MDPHRILGTTPESKPEEIVAAYRERVKKHHPDAGGDEWAFILVERAFAHLSSHNFGRWREEMAWTTSAQPEAAVVVPKNDISSAADEASNRHGPTPSSGPTGTQTADTINPERHAEVGQQTCVQWLKAHRFVSGDFVLPSGMSGTIRFLAEVAVATSVYGIATTVLGFRFSSFSFTDWRAIVCGGVGYWLFIKVLRPVSNSTLVKWAIIGLLCLTAIVLSIRHDRARLRSISFSTTNSASWWSKSNRETRRVSA